MALGSGCWRRSGRARNHGRGSWYSDLRTPAWKPSDEFTPEECCSWNARYRNSGSILMLDE